MAQSKPQHYWRQLRSVLTAGLWDARTPAKDTHGKPVSWSDLLRKFHKHCPGHPDVAELASQTQALSLLLSANYDGLDGNNVSPQGVLVLGEECMLPEQRIEEAMAGYTALKQLDPTRSDVRGAVRSIPLSFDMYVFLSSLRKPRLRTTRTRYGVPPTASTICLK